MGARLAWLGLTPEPERELPIAVATLRARSAGRPESADQDLTPWILAPWIDAESRRIDRLILRGTERTWLGYLAEVTRLVTEAATSAVLPQQAAVILRAAEAVLEHHRMLIGLPGRGYLRVAADREALTAVVARLREVVG